MLKFLRHRKTAKRVWIGLALIIIPAFALWGFGGAFGDKEDKQSLGKIFGKPVSALELRDAVSAVRTTAIMRFGDKFPEVEKYLDLEAQAWQRLILLHEAKQRGIKVSDKDVVEFIEGLPFFQYKGKFDNKTYTQILQYVFRLKPRAFEEQARGNLILSKLYAQATGNAKVEDKDLRAEYEKANLELSIDYIAALFADFAKKIRPGENELRDYFEKNKDKFKQESGEGKEAVIPEFKTVKNKVKEAFVRDESRRSAEEKINQCLQELKTRDFKAAAKKWGFKIKETKPFKFGAQIEGIGASDAFWQAARSLKPDQPSQVIGRPEGFYIIQVKKILPLDEKKYEQEKPSLNQLLLDRKKEALFSQFMIELDKKAR